jgi:hypothetical protein
MPEHEGTIDIIDFNRCPRSDRWYSGNAGRKEGIIFDGAPWLIKFPKHLPSTGDRMLSYSNSPIGEYLGSHIYESLGIPVHETMLGFREGKLVVACKDFLSPGKELVEFKEITIHYPHAEEYDFDQGSGNGTVLSDVLTTIDNAYPLDRISAVASRFWDMFVVDYFIGNNDRNNTNWGLIRCGTDYQLAPVYDNGRAFMEKYVLDYLDLTDFESPELTKSYQCNFLDDNGNYLRPHDLIMSGKYPTLSEAVKCFLSCLDMQKIFSLIDSIPFNYNETAILPTNEKQLFKKILEKRLDITFST